MERAPTLFAASSENPTKYAEDEFLAILGLTMKSDIVGKDDPAMQRLADAGFGAQVMLGRLTNIPSNPQFSLGSIIYAISATTNPGVAVMWAYTLYEEGKKLGRPIAVEDILKTFPFGYPSDDACTVIWDKQKLPRDQRENGNFSDNWLDTKEAWV
jgi:hypothetical protein